MTARAINLRQLLSEAFGFTFGELLEEQIAPKSCGKAIC